MIVTKTFLWAVLFIWGLGLETWQGYALASLAFVRFGYYVIKDARRVRKSPI